MILKTSVHTCARWRRQWVKCIVGIRSFHRQENEATTTVSLSHLKQCFKQRYLNVTNGHACIIGDCPICQTSKKDAKVYVNKTTGFFVCDKCRHIGPWEVLEKILSIKKSTDVLKEQETLRANLQKQDDFTKEWKDIVERCQDVSHLPTNTYKDILQAFSLPNISQEDMCQLSCTYESTTNMLHFPLIGLGNHLVGYKSLSMESKSEVTVPPAHSSGCIVYKQKNVKSDGSGVVVDTIHDMLTLVSRQSASMVICLPHNLRFLPQELLPSLEVYKKLILWFGNDEPSWYTAKHFAKKLHEERCYFVRPIATQPRPMVADKMGYDLKGILKNAQSIWHKSITTFHQLREDVLSDLQNIDKVQGVKWKRYPALNRILKGHRRGEFTVLTGPTGCGKTTLMSEYSLDLAMQGVNTLWGSFEIRNARLARTMLQQMVGVPLDQNLQNFDSYADAFEKLPVYFMTFHGQQSIKVVMDAVEHATYVHDIAHVVIDNVQFMMGTAEESKHMDRFWKQDAVIARFRNFATKFNCHVTAIIHPRKERHDEELTTSSIFGGAKATQEADNVLIIQDKRLSSVRGKKYLQVAKNRYSGDLGIMALEFDKTSLSYASKKKSKSEKAEEGIKEDN